MYISEEIAVTSITMIVFFVTWIENVEDDICEVSLKLALYKFRLCSWVIVVLGQV